MLNGNFIVQVENYELHKDRIEKGPYIRQMDLAITCSQLLHMTQREMLTNRVTWEMLSLWDMSPEELFRQASENSKRTLTPTIEPMSDVIKSFLMEEFLENAREDLEGALEKAEQEYEKLFGVSNRDMPEIYVLSNELRIQGASVIFYDDVLYYFAKEKKCNLILLPSCVHEWLILLEPEAGKLEDLKAMVRDANLHVVQPEEILSNSIYRYLVTERKIEIIDGDIPVEAGI